MSTWNSKVLWFDDETFAKTQAISEAGLWDTLRSEAKTIKGIRAVYVDSAELARGDGYSPFATKKLSELINEHYNQAKVNK